jgi:hypothetical protein
MYILILCKDIILNVGEIDFEQVCAPGFINYKKGCTRLAAASDKDYQLFAHGRWFPPGTPASSTTKIGRHDIQEMLL